MHKLHNIIITPKGLARITRFHRNGLVRTISITNPDTIWLFKRSEIDNFPLANRAATDKSDITRSQTTVYRAWRTMLHKPAHVCDEWREFEIFATWYAKQIKGRPGGVKWVVETGLLIPGNTRYGPDVCCVVPQQISTAFRFRRVDRDLPLGVSRNNEAFSAYCGNKAIGVYQTVDDAAAAYWAVKIRSIHDLAVRFWNHIPEPLAMRLISFDQSDADAYFCK